MESAIDALDSPRAAAALALVDARFKAISSLKEIIVNVYDEPAFLITQLYQFNCNSIQFLAIQF
jgi:hypothetical protein